MIAYTNMRIPLLIYYYVSLSATVPAAPAAVTEFPLVAPKRWRRTATPRSSVSLSVATAIIEATIRITCARGSGPQECYPGPKACFSWGYTLVHITWASRTISGGQNREDA